MSDITTWDIKTEWDITVWDNNIGLALILWWEELFEKHANVWENRKKLDNLIEKINNNDWNTIKVSLVKPNKTFDKIIILIDNFIDEIISYYTKKRLSNAILSWVSFTFIY